VLLRTSVVGSCWSVVGQLLVSCWAVVASRPLLAVVGSCLPSARACTQSCRTHLQGDQQQCRAGPTRCVGGARIVFVAFFVVIAGAHLRRCSRIPLNSPVRHTFMETEMSSRPHALAARGPVPSGAPSLARESPACERQWCRGNIMRLHKVQGFPGIRAASPVDRATRARPCSHPPKSCEASVNSTATEVLHRKMSLLESR
jgi:hypothetical protein